MWISGTPIFLNHQVQFKTLDRGKDKSQNRETENEPSQPDLTLLKLGDLARNVGLGGEAMGKEVFLIYHILYLGIIKVNVYTELQETQIIRKAKALAVCKPRLAIHLNY